MTPQRGAARLEFGFQFGMPRLAMNFGQGLYKDATSVPHPPDRYPAWARTLPLSREARIDLEGLRQVVRIRFMNGRREQRFECF